jgi:plastocyanin
MRRPALHALVAVVLVLSTTATVGAATDPTSINIVDAPRPQPKWGFAPGTDRIQPGTWVTWSNDGQDAHTVTALDGSFDSGNLDPSEGYSWYFDQPGTFEYVCALHPWMKGKIIVGNGIAPAAPSDPGEDAPPADDPSLQASG